MTHIIGFATEFYTLWSYEKENVYAGNVVMNGVGPQIIGINHRYYYIKNISKDLEKAKALYPGVEIDEELRGVTRSFERFEKAEYPANCFSFGMLAGKEIATLSHSKDHVWQLFRAMNQENGGRRRVLARRRLIEMGELLRYKHTEIQTRWKRVEDFNEYDYREGSHEEPYTVEIKHNYATPKFIEINESKKRQAAQPYFFTDGQKVELSIKQVGATGFTGTYGYTFIRIYETEDGKTVKYTGSSPIDLVDGFNKVKATIKHKEFRGNKETHLLRMRVV